MNARMLIIFLVVLLPVAYYLGLTQGRQMAEESLLSPMATESEVVAEAMPEHQAENSLSALNKVNAEAGSVSPASVQKPAGAAVTEPDEEQTSGEELSEALADAFTPGKEHLEARREFNRSFSTEEADWQRQTYISDFLQLHQDSDKLDMHKIICATDKCQLIGRYNGDHEGWNQIVQEMQQQDWWDYSGTSNSSSTEDGVTYFNLYIDKRRAEDN